MFCTSLMRYSLAASWLVLTLDVTAGESVNNSPNARMRYVALSAQSDGADNNQVIGALSLTVGDHAWVQMGAGKLKVQQGNDTLNPTLANIGFGIAGQQLGFALDASRRKDGDRYNQRDWNATLEWHNETMVLGIDGLHRNTDVRGTVATADGQGGTVVVPASQSLHGNGIGLHAKFNLTEQLTLSVGGMHYNYDTQTHQDGVATTSGNGGVLGTIVNNALNNQPLLAQQLLTQVSGATRDAAILQHSWNVGIGYRLDHAALSAKYFNDKAPDSTGAISTVELGAALFLNEHWTVSPSIGHSSGGPSGSVTFGALTTSFGW